MQSGDRRDETQEATPGGNGPRPPTDRRAGTDDVAGASQVAGHGAAQVASDAMAGRAGAGADDVTRTRSGTGDDAILGGPGSDVTGERRLPAPLQYRDPDRYEIIAEHGRGGLGRVYRARDKELGRDVALKELLSRGSIGELRFFREALITARLEHPGIVPVHEAGRWPDGTPFYAMKLVAGRPLKELIEACSTLEERLALLPHIIAVADAIAYAHDRKIIHRDLKPSNIIVGDFGETVVIDWGLAKDISDRAPPEDAPLGDGPFRTAPGRIEAHDDAGGDGVTVAGSVLGTPAYMSPEQARGEPVDERTDVYAIGRILQDVARGTPPGPPRRDHRATPALVPPALAAIANKASHPTRTQRYDSARHIGDDLRNFTARRPVSAHHYSLSERVWRWASGHRTALTTSVACLLVLLVASAIALSGYSRREELAQHHRRVAEERVDALILARAHDWLSKDPRQSLLWLARYRGLAGQWQQAAALAADAESRGYTTHLLSGHVGRITSLAASGDGAAAVSTSTDGLAILWRVGDGTIKPVSRCNGYTEDATTHARAPDFLAISSNGSGRLFFCDLGRNVHRDASAPFTPALLAFSPSGTRLLAVGTDGDAAVLDVSTLSVLWHTRFPERISAASFVSDERLVLGFPAVAHQIDSRTGTPVHHLRLDHGPLIAVAREDADALLLTDQGCLTILPTTTDPPAPSAWHCPPSSTTPTAQQKTDPTFALAGLAGTISASREHVAISVGQSSWIAARATMDFASVPFPPGVMWLGLDPPSAVLYAAHQNGDISWYSVDGNTVGRLAGHDRFATMAAFMRLRTDWRLVSAGADSHLRVWSPVRPSSYSQPLATKALYDVVAFGPRSQYAVDGQDGQVRILAPVSPATAPERLGVVDTVPGDGSVARGLAAAAPVGVASAHWSGAVHVWRPGRPGLRLAAPTAIRAVAANDLGTKIAGGGLNGILYLWTLDDASPEAFPRHDGPITRVAFMRDGDVVTTGMDGTLQATHLGIATSTRLWQTSSPIETLAVDLTGTLIAAGDREGHLVILQRAHARYELLHELHVGDWVSALSFSDESLLGGTRTGLVVRIVPQTGESFAAVGHDGMIRELLPLAGGSFLTSSQDSTVRLWGPQHWTSTVFRALPDDVLEGISVSRDMRTVFAVGWMGRLYAWKLDTVTEGAPATPALLSWIAARVSSSEDEPDIALNDKEKKHP